MLVSRAFTAYQLTELVRRLEPEKVGGIVVVSGICTAFFDEDISHKEAARLFYRTLWRITELAKEGLTLLLTESQAEAPVRRSYFLTDLGKASQVIVRLTGAHSFTLEHRSSRARPYLAYLTPPVDQYSHFARMFLRK